MTAIDILYVGTLYPPHRGGSGMLGAQLLAGLAARGHRIRALAAGGPAIAAEGGADLECAHPGIQTTWLPVQIASSALYEGSRDSTYREAEDAGIRTSLPRLIAERRPDVILIGRESSVGEVPPIAGRHGIPTVALVQGGTTIRAILAGGPDALARHQLQQLRRVDVIVAIAAHLRDALASLALPLAQVSLIPNPVDLELFTPGPKPVAFLERLGLDARSIVVSHLSNFKRAKRVGDVVASAERVLATHPEVAYLFLGDGPDRAHAEAQCRAAGLTERVRFTGWVDRVQIPDYLRATDVVVMASESEGLSLVCLEAQASERTLVASDIPATRELVSDGRTGLIFPMGDVDALTAQTLRAARDPTLRGAIGRAARVAAHAYAEPAIVDAYSRLLEEVVAARRPVTGTDNSGDAVRERWAERLGEDLWALVLAHGGRLVAATPVGTLSLPRRSRAAFRLAFADGHELKGRRVTSDDCAARVERWSSHLDPRHFPRLLARRGAALLSEWVEGTPGAAVADASLLCRQAGALQGALHRAPVPEDERQAGRTDWLGWARRLDRDLRALRDAGWLDRITVSRATTAAEDAAPREVELGLVHSDLCLENLVLREGNIQVVDTEDLRVYAYDHDLARTWYRWPLAGVAWDAYREGYETVRPARTFREHFAHWAVVVLVESAVFRLRAGATSAEQPLGCLHELLTAAEASGLGLPGAPALPAYRG